MRRSTLKPGLETLKLLPFWRGASPQIMPAAVRFDRRETRRTLLERMTRVTLVPIM
jgi:hypothetical protein